MDKLELIHNLNTSMIYLMGGSFVLGSAFTIFLLIVLDWTRSRHQETTDE